MAHVTTRDNVSLYAKAWGTGRPVILIHGWPLSADSWDEVAMVLADAGYAGGFQASVLSRVSDVIKSLPMQFLRPWELVDTSFQTTIPGSRYTSSWLHSASDNDASHNSSAQRKVRLSFVYLSRTTCYRNWQSGDRDLPLASCSITYRQL